MYVHTLFIVYFVQLLDRCHHVYIAIDCLYSLKCEGTKPPANDWHIAIYTESNLIPPHRIE